ncbi:MATH and LRR domain-containing protein PFE0570w [Teleopsis dalmanni]|uniref:MATH and LRR domain-containing protein PFE0570w n=1 Tax=Teleopsis dalmanni TaxID=139649 RepID=UPI0018CEC682|nr:MATH and LRR domain-containing protein PFE0570w [Teleopsis dalmanni]
MFNKLKFNNIVISNKKIIQQGRNQIINKLVHKLKKFQYLLEKNDENIKNKNRMRRNVAYLEHLKKLKRFEIIKSVLLLEKNPTAVITNDRAAPEEIVIAMLAANKLIADLVKKIHEELNINSKDNAWKEKLMENSKRQTKMEKVEYRRLKRKEIKDQRNVERKRKEWLQENNADKINDSQDKELNLTSSSGNWIEEELEGEDSEDLEESITEIPSNKLKSEKSKATHVLQNKKENNTKQIKKENKVEAVQINQIKSEANLTSKVKINSTVNIESRQDNDIGNNEEISMANEYVNEDSKIKDDPITNGARENTDINISPSKNVNVNENIFVEDPFFITETGKPYMSTAIVTNKTQNVSEEVVNNKSNVGNKRKIHDRNNYQSENRNFHKQNSELNSKWKNKDNQMNKSENLHPSWAAKQKQKPIITNFQGKKITFNDDDNMEQTVPQNNFNKNKNSNGAGKGKTSNKVENNLHPSWAAKQKQKPTITAFEGKKIKFDDDDS